MLTSGTNTPTNNVYNSFDDIHHQPWPNVLDTRATTDSAVTIPLHNLSEQIRISSQTLVRWVDRHLIDAQLGWDHSDHAQIRTIRIEQSTLDFLRTFASEYRDDTVSRTEARRLLKKIDPRNVKRLIRAGDIETVQIGEDVRIVIGSIEDYLLDRERDEETVA